MREKGVAVAVTAGIIAAVAYVFGRAVKPAEKQTPKPELVPIPTDKPNPVEDFLGSLTESQKDFIKGVLSWSQKIRLYGVESKPKAEQRRIAREFVRSLTREQKERIKAKLTEQQLAMLAAIEQGG